MFCVTVLMTIALQNPAAGVSDARQIVIAAPQPIVDVDTGKMKGEPWRLAWSPDGSEMYLQTVDRDRSGNVTSAKHYIVSVAAKTVKGVDQEPPWASKYWTWKSGQASPGAPAFKIAIESRDETVRATSAPTGGALAKGGSAGDPNVGSTSQDAASAAFQSQVKHIVALRLRGETLGEWVNEAVTPGTSFAWAPTPHSLIVYTRREGGPLAALDEQGHKQVLPGARSATFPAFSENGTRLAWLERKDKKHYDLTVADVSSK
jgi:hypothetical protein